MTITVKKDLCNKKAKNQKMTLKELMDYALKEHNLKIGKSTMSDIIRDKSKWLNFEDSNSTRQTFVKHKDLEDALSLWFTQARSNKLLLNDELLTTKAKQLGEKIGITDFKYSDG